MEREKERLVSGHLKEGSENRMDMALRPTGFDSFIGQVKIKRNLKVFIRAARERKESLDHILLYGPPGLGKTTLAHIIAREMGINIRVTSGPAIERPGDLAAILTNLAPGDVLFIDEVHRLHRSVEEILYPAMEDFALDLIIGKGPSARSLRLDLSPFTLVGATTRAGLLSSPLRDRFGVVSRLEFYQVEELAEIIKKSAHLLQVPITDGGARQVATCSRGTPRVANRLLKRIRDFAQVEGNNKIDEGVAARSLDLLEVDRLGLDNTDRKLLLTIIQKFSGGPVGLDTLAAAINEETGTVEDVYEPYLIQLGFLNRTPRGRVVTPQVYRHLDLEDKGRHYAQGSILD